MPLIFRTQRVLAACKAHGTTLTGALTSAAAQEMEAMINKVDRVFTCTCVRVWYTDMSGPLGAAPLTCIQYHAQHDEESGGGGKRGSKGMPGLLKFATAVKGLNKVKEAKGARAATEYMYVRLVVGALGRLYVHLVLSWEAPPIHQPPQRCTFECVIHKQ